MNPLKLASVVTALYGLIAAGGGLTGFITKGSLPSLIAGGISGLLLITAGFWMRNKKAGGLILAQVVGVALLVKFGKGAMTAQTLLNVGMSVGALLVLGTSSSALRHRMKSADA